MKMTATTEKQLMAFFHEDGLVPAWNFAKRYAGPSGRIATLPDIVAARLATKPGGRAWEEHFTTNTAEYYGIGADGREKLIVAHGVGPMSTLEGIKQAYAWEYKDRRNHQGGRISSQEFLQLEAGHYGKATVIESAEKFMELDTDGNYPVFVIDFGQYVAWAGEFFLIGPLDAPRALQDLLLLARLGVHGPRYINCHRTYSIEWHAQQFNRADEDYEPHVLTNEGASNYPYTSFEEVNGLHDWAHPKPRLIEKDKAVGHLLSIGALMHYRFWNDHAHGEDLASNVICHEWGAGVRFVGMPDGSERNLGLGIAESLQPTAFIRQRWRELLQPVDPGYAEQRLYLVEHVGGEWFTRYPKLNDGARMDDGDIEFHVRSVRSVGAQAKFKVDEMFFLRYELSQVVALAPRAANAYSVVDISGKDGNGLTTVTVQFYVADIDTSQRLPRVKEIKQDYDLLMG